MLEDPMANEDFCEAMELCFGTILHNWEKTTDSNPTPILYIALFCVSGF
jgi:hypothetical protein